MYFVQKIGTYSKEVYKMEDEDDLSFFYKSERRNSLTFSKYAELFLCESEMDIFLKKGELTYTEEINKYTNFFLSRHFNTTLEELKEKEKTCGALELKNIPVLLYAYDNIAHDLFFARGYAKKIAYFNFTFGETQIENIGILASLEK